MAGLFAILFLFLVAFGPTLVWMYEAWVAPDSYFAHGPLLVLAGLYLLFERRKRLSAIPLSSDRRAAVILALLLLLHVGSMALQVDSFSGFLLVPTLFALVLTTMGPARLRASAAPLGCFFFAVPLPIFVTGRLAYVLKDLATTGSVWLGNLFGLGLVQDGARIRIPGQELPLLVGDACSGLRSLVALFALGYLCAFFLTRRHARGKLLFWVLSIPLAFAANLVRITFLAWLAKSKGVAYAAGPAHDVSGYGLYAVAIVALVLLDRVLPGRLAKDQKTRAPGSEARDDSTVSSSSKRLALPALLLVVLGLPACWLGFDRPGEPSEKLGASFPEQLGPWKLSRHYPLTDRWYYLLGTRDVAWSRYQNEAGQALTSTIVFHGRNWKALHPPELCLTGSGFEIVAKKERQIPGMAAAKVSVLAARKGGDRYLVAYVFGSQSFTTPSYLGFFLHNAPLALLRQNRRGYLLRVDSRLADSDGEAAEARTWRRLESYLRLALPRLSELCRKP